MNSGLITSVHNHSWNREKLYGDSLEEDSRNKLVLIPISAIAPVHTTARITDITLIKSIAIILSNYPAVTYLIKLLFFSGFIEQLPC